MLAVTLGCVYKDTRVSSLDAYPAIAAIVHRDQPSKAICGGTLVNSHWLLTASHCSLRPDDQIITGRLDLRSRDGRVHDVALFCPGPGGSDLALVRLVQASAQREMTFFEGRTPDDLAQREIRVFGWGRTEKGKPSRHLLYAELEVLPNTMCEEALGKVGDFDATMFFCAKRQGSAADTCAGDSGGPGLVSLNGTEWLQAGVISDGVGCGARPGQYAYAPGHLDWIRRQARSAETACVSAEPGSEP
jgi:secreted trypsin-like serine protease